MGVMNAMLVRLLVQEVEHVLDGQGQGGAPVCRAEDGLEEVVHELLQGALRVEGKGFRHSSAQRAVGLGCEIRPADGREGKGGGRAAWPAWGEIR